jgi:hypothetical protein
VHSVLAERIRSKKDELVATWETGVRTLASAARAPRPTLQSHIPAVLEWLAERLERSDLPDAERDAFSADHALERLSQGFDLVEVMSEWSFLRDVLLGVWEAEPDGVTPAEVRQLNRELDDVIAVSAVEYVRGTRAVEAEGDGGPSPAAEEAGAAAASGGP